MTNLYDITHEIEKINDLMERSAGDDALMTAEDREAMSAFVEGLKTETAIRADGFAKAIREVEARAEMRRLEARRIGEMAAADEKHAENVKRFLMGCMDRAGMKRIEGSLFTVAVQANGGKQPVEVFCETDKIPERFTRTKIEPDKDAIRDALLAGDKEASAVACLQPRGFSLRIK